MYADSLTVRAARDLHFAQGGFSEEGYTAKFVHFKLGPFGFWVPNSPGRTRALPYHDLNHVVSGYDTSWKGEGEIAAWELSSGCANYPTAFAINVVAMAIGLVIAPARTVAAYGRGKRSRNTYGAEIPPMLDRTVGDVRKTLGLA